MNKILSRILCALLCIGILLSFILPAFAQETGETPAYDETITIRNAGDFLSFAESCRLDSYSLNLLVELKADIDLTGTGFEAIPIFSGTFLGNGHTISGLTIAANGSDLGLFRYLAQTALVQDLLVAGEVIPDGSRQEIGGIAGSNAGTIRSCSFSGSVSGSQSVGGIAGVNTVTGVIENCQSSGQVDGSHFVGGIAGNNYGVIRGCTNRALVNTAARENEVSLSDITLDSLTNTESVNTVTDIGGIAGISSGVIRDCMNKADVGYQHMGYNIGGIAGTQSGYIADCINRGSIRGRKEVGGIVGQMEPSINMLFSEDTTQILSNQVTGLMSSLNQLIASTGNMSSLVSTPVENLGQQLETIKAALESLTPDLEDPQLPDEDTVEAAKNALSGALRDMTGSMESAFTSLQSTMSGMTGKMQSMSSQLNAMLATINNASESSGGTLTDISDLDTELTLNGKAEGCTNYGSVLADANVGGIVGAMSVENDLDAAEDVAIFGDSSLNFDAQLRAVILDCHNSGSITCTKENAGGIVGWMYLGLVKDCRNTGCLDSESADYVGGIAGRSNGRIRSGSVKADISGSTCVGGIAGSGTVVTDCRSMVLLQGNEKIGAILGQAGESDTEEENPVSGNYYTNIYADHGGIDGVSYAGAAESLEMEAFRKLEDLPSLFEQVTVSFRHESGNTSSCTISVGTPLGDIYVPRLPAKAGYEARWEGLEEAQNAPLYFDVTFQAAYIPLETTISSPDTAADGLPQILAEGAFASDGILTMSGSIPELPQVPEDMELWEVAEFTIPESESAVRVRYRILDDCSTKTLHLLRRTANGVWEEIPFSVSGSYIVFDASTGVNAIALMQETSSAMPLAAIAAGTVLLAAAAFFFLRRKKKAKK